MARKLDLCRASNGQFVRNLGWQRSATGYSQHKFYLGRDEATAKVASLRLEQVWTQVAKRWERERATELLFRSPDWQLQDVAVRGRSHVALTAHGVGKPVATLLAEERPVWDELTLEIAGAVRRGESLVKVSPPLPNGTATKVGPFSASDWLATLQDDITVIRIELVDDAMQRKFDEGQQREAHQHIEHGRKLLHKKAGGETLHVAFTAYKKWIGTRFVDAEKRPTDWGNGQTRMIEFIQCYLPNCTLAEMGTQRIEEHLDIIRLRPQNRLRSKDRKGKQISAIYAKSCIKQYRSFLRWLNRSEEFGWKRPADLEIDQVRIPLTPQEKSASVRSSQVKTYTPEELKTCWEYASPFQRLLMLLGLNCGFGRAEIASLEMDELLLNQKHPQESEVGCTSTAEDGWVLRARQKTGVYGEHKLWPETIKALEWWLKQRAAIKIPAGITTVLVTEKGRRYDAHTKSNHPNYQLPNSWLALTDRIQKDIPGFRKLSFKILRKTAGNLIRKAADGEVAGVFLNHGQPVKSDELLDLYTNRDFAKVFDAIDVVGQKLRPLWTGVSEPFPEVRKKGGTNISMNKIRRIQEMKRQGFKTGVIMEKLKVSRPTVCRWAKQVGEAIEPMGDQ